MSITNNYNQWVGVGEKHRVWIVEKTVPDWFAQERFYLWPKAWQTDVVVPEGMFFNVWVATLNRDAIPIMNDATDDFIGNELSALVFSSKLGQKTGSKTATRSWIIPKIHRLQGWLPSNGGVLLLRTFPDFVEIWHGDAYQEHAKSLSESIES